MITSIRLTSLPGTFGARHHVLQTANSLYGAWDEQFYPDGVGAWMTKLDVGEGGMSFDERFFLEGEVFRGRRAHQVRLEGGDASSDSYCYSS